MKVQLRRLGPNSRTKVLTPPPNGAVKIWLAGRGTFCQICTKSKYASRKHFSITYRDGNYYLTDLQSANGTFLNNDKITSEERLNFGNTISVGVPPSLQDVPDSIIYAFEKCTDSNAVKDSIADNDILIIDDTTSSSSVKVNVKSENLNLGCSSVSAESSEKDCIIIDDSLEIENEENNENNEIEEVEENNKHKIIEENNKHKIIEENNEYEKMEENNEFEIIEENNDYEKLDENNECEKMEENIDCEKTEENNECDKIVENIDCEKTEENNKCDQINENNEYEKTEVNEEERLKENTVIGNNSVTQNLKRPRHSSPDASVSEEKPAKIMKLLEGNVPDSEIKTPSPKNNSPIESEADEDENDLMAYNVCTQVDETSIKTEPDLLNYSQVEELIEISDSENEDWNLESTKNEALEEEEEEEDDNDVMFIEQIIRNKESTGLLPVVFTSDTDLTETDRKWVGKLLKIKQEMDLSPEKTNSMEITETDSTEKIIEALTEPEAEPVESDICSSNFSSDHQTTVFPPMEKSSENEVHLPVLQKVSEKTVSSEKPIHTVKKKVPKKTVRFDLVPKIKYFEVPTKVKFTAEEKGNKYFTQILFNICNWNTVWLEECKRVASDKDPPDICKIWPLRKIPKKFVSHSDYMSSFAPVMLLHLWNKVKDNWKQCGNSAFKQTVSLDFLEDYQAENLYVCQCTGVVQNLDAHKQLLRNGHLVMLSLNAVREPTTPAKKYTKKLSYLVFGFLKFKAYEKYQNQPLHESLAERCSTNRGNLHLVKLTIIVKKRPNLKVDNQKLVQITAVHHISSDIKMFSGICFLPRSLLCKAILKPNKVEFSLCSPSEKKEFVFKGSLDSHQKEIVSKLSYTCSSTDSFLYSIHGAAGTGKGQVITALILELLYGNEWKKTQRPKIIYCTSSASPLDEMISRLKTCRESIDAPSKFSIVRVGPGKEFNLSTLVKNLRYSDQVLQEKNKIDVEAKILSESDVICTLCSLTGLSSMILAFERKMNLKKDQKIICILDEAMSCKESDSMLPLFLGVTHFILVGDLYLSEPSFSAEKTHSLGLDRSLFSRLYKNYANIPKDLWPAYFLKTQFRMHPALSKFATSVVYNRKLRDCTLTSKYKINELPSYLVVIDQTPKDVLDSEMREGKVVFELVKAITKIINARPFNIFILTCEPKQTEVIQCFLTKGKYPEVEINQLLKFQGRESDIVLFPYNGTNMIYSHLALPLTRAKSSLIVLASQTSITNNLWFQKLSKDAEERNALKYINTETTPEGFESLLYVGKNEKRKSR